MLLRQSSEPFVFALFAPQPAAQAGRPGRKPPVGRAFCGVVGKYAAELDVMLRIVATTRAHFVRCSIQRKYKCAYM